MMAGNHLTETFVYSGGSRRGARGTWASPYFWIKLRPEGPKKFFLGDRPPSLSEGLDDPQPPSPPIPRSGSGTSLLPSFCHESVNSSLEEHKNIKVMLFLLPELFRLFR